MNRSYTLIRTAVVGGLAAAAVLAGAMFSGPKVAFADSPDGLSSGQRVVGQTCTGSGDDYKCLYCIYADGIKDCFWVKVPEPKPATPANDLWVATVMPGAMAKEQFIRNKPHVNVGDADAHGVVYEQERLCEIDDGMGGTFPVHCAVAEFEPYLQLELENTLDASAGVFASSDDGAAEGRIIVLERHGKMYMLELVD